MLNYLLLSSSGLLILALFYFGFHKNETFFQQNRIILLLGIIVSLTFPLFENLLTIEQQVYITEILPTVYLPEITIGKTSNTINLLQSWSWKILVLLGYTAITLILSLRFFYSNIKLFVFIRKHPPQRIKGSLIINTEGLYPTFAYLKYIFWDNTKALSPKEEKLIFLHEQTHIKELHSLDIFVMEILKIIFWFNPAIYIIDAALRTQHEYLADQKANQMTNDASYSQLMIRSLFEDNSISIGHGFQFSTIKNRIKMLKKERTNQWKRISSLFTFSILISSIIFLQACIKDELEATDPKLSEYNQEMIYGYNYNGRTYWDTNSIYSENLDEGEIESINVVKGLSLPPVFNSNVKTAIVIQFRNDLNESFFNKVKEELPSTSHLVTPISKKPNSLQKGVISIDELNNDEKTYEIVQNSAFYPDGMDSFYKSIGQIMKYPKKAREKGIEGKVYLQFVINKDGNGEDFKIVNSDNSIFDEEVLRIAELTIKDWTPANHEGKIVKQRLVLPISFKL
ncbi:M56 family metallopeptidase [Flammeovirga kamogawensis]|uniref:M56 family metallopeptidase n=1 Tax=Flammeovirga kamogawensis TaxID=373891 RepID=A0ABX8GUN8_9BACT|nr:M56 family metallopeptidase [Flammeovirga kamogawensis]MBB6459623.1 TonB family protein [Flammeovirga kamogawensis]QWG07314.1 M56 family metallopeptidase [Flammeovirga kamogawensis]TRX69131.1 M56 family metallopeptidase [Flammeovirga kamogawensis]